jgi:spermidine synthase
MSPRSCLAALIYILFFASGGAALGYQLVWAKMFSSGLGHEIPSVLAVICAFMGGMSLGSWFLAGRISSSRAPTRWYASLEMTIALWAIVSVWIIPRVNDLGLALIGPYPTPWRHWFVAFSIPFATLLPATVAMGATFAAMERMVRTLASRQAGSVAPVYASNTAGAVAGTLLTAFLLMPLLGFRRSAFVLATVNLTCGLVAFALRTKTVTAALRKDRIPVRLGVTVLFTGFLGIAYETAGIRVLSTVLENTIYTFAAALAVFLLGTSAGAALYHRCVGKSSIEVIASRLLLWLAISCLVGIWPIALSSRVYYALRSASGPNVLAELAVAVLVFLPPAILMGALFSHLVQAAAHTIAGVGRMTALNTLGAALAPLLTGIVAIPLLGAKWTLLVIALAYAVLVSKWAALRWSPLLLVVAVLSAVAADLKLVNIPPGGKVVDFREGVMASVAVVEDNRGERGLRINNRFQQGGTASANAEYRQAHMPLLLHANPKSALFLGIGTGITLGGASLHTGLRSHAVELVPEVVKVLPHFESANFGIPNASNVTVSVADARRYVRTTTNQYDVIVADLFHPAMDGAGMLYTIEHFRAIRGRLAPDGLFCQWLPLHQLDDSLVRSIGRTFVEVFPNAQAWLLRFNVDVPALGLIGWVTPTRYEDGWIEARLSESSLKSHIRQLTLSESVRFFSHALVDTPTLQAFCDGAPLNTDDRPGVIFAAPHVTHEGSEPYRSLVALLNLPLPDPATVLGSQNDTGIQARLVLCWKARHRYLHGLIAEEQGREPEAIEAYVESARLSPDFTLGYARGITLASIRAKIDPEFARRLLQQLAEAQPSQQLAQDMLKRMFQ